MSTQKESYNAKLVGIISNATEQYFYKLTSVHIVGGSYLECVIYGQVGFLSCYFNDENSLADSKLTIGCRILSEQKTGSKNAHKYVLASSHCFTPLIDWYLIWSY